MDTHLLAMARELVARLLKDPRANAPSGQERTAYNKELKVALATLKKLEAAEKAPAYKKIQPDTAPRVQKIEGQQYAVSWPDNVPRCVLFALGSKKFPRVKNKYPEAYQSRPQYQCKVCFRLVKVRSRPINECHLQQ